MEIGIACQFRHDVVVIGVKPFGHFTGKGRFACRGVFACHAEILVKFVCPLPLLETRWQVAQHQTGVQHMVVQGEIAHWHKVQPRLLLDVPVLLA